MKIKHLIFAAFILVGSILFTFIIFSVDSRSKTKTTTRVVARARYLAGDNEYFFIGLYGAVTPGFYLSRGDKENLIYCPNDKIYRGCASSVVEAFLVNATNNKITQVNANDLLEMNHGLVVLFTPDLLYVLNFDSGEFGYYERK